MQKFLIASCLAVAALAAPEAKADAYYGHGYGLAHGAALVGPSGFSAAWPAVRGYGVQSTCYGCRGHIGYGKRSADADAYYGYGHGLSYRHGLSYGYGLAHHGGHATSFVARSPQGLSVHGLGHHYGKREAEADAEAYYGYGHGLAYSHGLTYGRGLAYGHGLTTYAHAPVATIAHSVAPVATVAHAVAPIATVAYAAAPVATYSHGLGHHAISSNVYSGHTGNTYVTGLPGRSYAAVSRLHKREAEAEAEAEPEADAYYGSYGHSLGYAGYGHGYGLGYGRGYAGLGYSHGGYAGHGYGHGYGYGYYG